MPDCVDPDDDGDGVADATDRFPLSDLSPTVLVRGVDTGVVNRLTSDGSSLNDLISEAASSSTTRAHFIRAVTELVNAWAQAGLITSDERKILLRAATAR